MKIISWLPVEKWKWVLPMIFLMVTVTGCVVYYEQPGKTTQDFAREKRNCEAVAEQEYVRKGTRVCDEIDLCLISKGWKRSD